MSKEDIDRAMREAEQFAEEDKKQKEAVDTKNHAESLIFQSEKTLGEIGDKVTDEDKAPVKEAIEKLRTTVAGGDTAAIKADTEALEKAFYGLSEKLYKAQGAAGAGPDMGADPNMGGQQGGDGFYNADFEDKSNQ
jgi:molecular chaperone DnaK